MTHDSHSLIILDFCAITVFKFNLPQIVLSLTKNVVLRPHTLDSLSDPVRELFLTILIIVEETYMYYLENLK